MIASSALDTERYLCCLALRLSRAQACCLWEQRPLWPWQCVECIHCSQHGCAHAAPERQHGLAAPHHLLPSSGSCKLLTTPERHDVWATPSSGQGGNISKETMLANSQAVRQARPMRWLLEPQLSFVCGQQGGQSSASAARCKYTCKTYNCNEKCFKAFAAI